MGLDNMVAEVMAYLRAEPLALLIIVVAIAVLALAKTKAFIKLVAVGLLVAAVLYMVFSIATTGTRSKKNLIDKSIPRTSYSTHDIR